MNYFQRKKAIKAFRKQIKQNTCLRIKPDVQTDVTIGRIWVVSVVRKDGVIMIIKPQSAKEAVSVGAALDALGPPFCPWHELWECFDIYTPGDSVEEAMREESPA